MSTTQEYVTIQSTPHRSPNLKAVDWSRVTEPQHVITLLKALDLEFDPQHHEPALRSLLVDGPPPISETHAKIIAQKIGKTLNQLSTMVGGDYLDLVQQVAHVLSMQQTEVALKKDQFIQHQAQLAQQAAAQVDQQPVEVDAEEPRIVSVITITLDERPGRIYVVDQDLVDMASSIMNVPGVVLGPQHDDVDSLPPEMVEALKTVIRRMGDARPHVEVYLRDLLEGTTHADIALVDKSLGMLHICSADVFELLANHGFGLLSQQAKSMTAEQFDQHTYPQDNVWMDVQAARFIYAAFHNVVNSEPQQAADQNPKFTNLDQLPVVTRFEVSAPNEAAITTRHELTDADKQKQIDYLNRTAAEKQQPEYENQWVMPTKVADKSKKEGVLVGVIAVDENDLHLRVWDDLLAWFMDILNNTDLADLAKVTAALAELGLTADQAVKLLGSTPEERAALIRNAQDLSCGSFREYAKRFNESVAPQSLSSENAWLFYDILRSAAVNQLSVNDRVKMALATSQDGSLEQQLADLSQEFKANMAKEVNLLAGILGTELPTDFAQHVVTSNVAPSFIAEQADGANSQVTYHMHAMNEARPHVVAYLVDLIMGTLTADIAQVDAHLKVLGTDRADVLTLLADGRSFTELVTAAQSMPAKEFNAYADNGRTVAKMSRMCARMILVFFRDAALQALTPTTQHSMLEDGHAFATVANTVLADTAADTLNQADKEKTLVDVIDIDGDIDAVIMQDLTAWFTDILNGTDLADPDRTKLSLAALSLKTDEAFLLLGDTPEQRNELVRKAQESSRAEYSTYAATLFKEQKKDNLREEDVWMFYDIFFNTATALRPGGAAQAASAAVNGDVVSVERVGDVPVCEIEEPPANKTKSSNSPSMPALIKLPVKYGQITSVFEALTSQNAYSDMSAKGYAMMAARRVIENLPNTTEPSAIATALESIERLGQIQPLAFQSYHDYITYAHRVVQAETSALDEEVIDELLISLWKMSVVVGHPTDADYISADDRKIYEQASALAKSKTGQSLINAVLSNFIANGTPYSAARLKKIVAEVETYYWPAA